MSICIAGLNQSPMYNFRVIAVEDDRSNHAGDIRLLSTYRLVTQHEHIQIRHKALTPLYGILPRRTQCPIKKTRSKTRTSKKVGSRPRIW
jgi:hypothetical protein